MMEKIVAPKNPANKKFKGVYEGVFPSLILGREDFFSRTMICFDKNAKLIIKADNS